MRKVLHILGDFSDEDIAWLINVGIKKTIQPNEFLIAANVQLSAIYFVLNGRFNIELPNGKLIAKIKSGEILGEMSFIEEETPYANVMATDASGVISIAHEFLVDRFKECPSFEGRFYKAMSLFLSSRLRQLSHETVENQMTKEFGQDIDNATLDRIQIAGERFTRLLNHFG
jgi:CRP/FNR family cyclic AMP-dependent transcriptional regulator